MSISKYFFIRFYVKISISIRFMSESKCTYKNYLTFDDIFYAILLGALGHVYESILLRTAGEIADQSKYISYAGRAPAINTFGHTHT